MPQCEHIVQHLAHVTPGSRAGLLRLEPHEVDSDACVPSMRLDSTASLLRTAFEIS